MTGSRLMRASFLRPSLLALASAAMLAACGGGGGGDSGGSSSTQLAITSDNATAAARAGVAGMVTSEMAGTADSGIFGSSSINGIVDLQTRRAQSLAAHALAQGRSQIAASATVNCAVSGSMTVNFDDNNGNGAFDAVGESISISSANCVQDAGSSLSGAFTLTLNQFTSLTNLTLGLSFSNFSASDATSGMSAAINGSLTAARSSATLVTVRSDALTVGLTANGSSHSYSAQGLVATVDANSTRTQQTLSGTFSSSDFGGKSVKVSTPVAVQTLAADDYPSSGTVLVEGATGSVVKLEAVNATQVRQSLDANGDGTFESTVVKLWSDLF